MQIYPLNKIHVVTERISYLFYKVGSYPVFLWSSPYCRILIHIFTKFCMEGLLRNCTICPLFLMFCGIEYLHYAPVNLCMFTCFIFENMYWMIKIKVKLWLYMSWRCGLNYVYAGCKRVVNCLTLGNEPPVPCKKESRLTPELTWML